LGVVNLHSCEHGWWTHVSLTGKFKEICGDSP